MSQQNYETWNDEVRTAFENKANSQDGQRLALSWSNWGFGMESLATSAKRLSQAGIKWIELHGNHYGTDIGYDGNETKKILTDNGLQCSGICGMFSPESDLSSPSGMVRQEAIDYIRRTLDFAVEVDATYMLVVPGAVGRPDAYDASEWERSAAALRKVGEDFAHAGVRAAIEPIRAAETSVCHSIADAQRYINMVDHPAIAHINGDVYHMQSEEAHIGKAIIAAGERLTNLHMADSNRCALGEGSMDLDTIIRALYAIDYNREGCFCTPEPLGPGGDPYPAMHGKPDTELLNQMVTQTTEYFRQREEAVLASL